MSGQPAAACRLDGGPILCAAFDATFTQLAVSHHDKSIHIYEVDNSVDASPGKPSTSGRPAPSSAIRWRHAHTLHGHDLIVSGLDWAKGSGLLLSCSHDRNAFVWTPRKPSGSSPARAVPSGSSSGSSGSAWDPQMVITKLTKAALCAAWSPHEAKFALGSGAKAVCVGFYDPESKWWACKLIRKPHTSSVTALAWHPNSLVLATGSTDCKVRLFNAYLSGYEPPAPASAAGALPPGSAFGDCLMEVAHEGCGWLHGLAWAGQGPGAVLTYASHDKAVGAVAGPQVDAVLRLPGLPLKCLLPVSERLLVGGGWDGLLVLLRREGPGQPWKQAAVLGDGTGSGPHKEAAQGGIVRQMAQMAVGASPGPAPGSKAHAHTSCITQLLALPPGQVGARVVVTAGLDGRLLYWDVSAYV